METIGLGYGFGLRYGCGERGERRKAMETMFPSCGILNMPCGERGERRKAMETFAAYSHSYSQYLQVVNAENAERQWRLGGGHYRHTIRSPVVNAENAERQWRLYRPALKLAHSFA